MTVSVWMDQEQLRGRPALSPSSALSVSLQGEKKQPQNSFGFIDSVLECVFLTFSVLKLKKKKRKEKRPEELDHLSDTAAVSD